MRRPGVTGAPRGSATRPTGPRWRPPRERPGETPGPGHLGTTRAFPRCAPPPLPGVVVRSTSSTRTLPRAGFCSPRCDKMARGAARRRATWPLMSSLSSDGPQRAAPQRAARLLRSVEEVGAATGLLFCFSLFQMFVTTEGQHRSSQRDTRHREKSSPMSDYLWFVVK